MTALFARSFLVLMLFLSLAGAATSSLDTVDIVATGVTAQEGGTPGRFTLSRTGSSGSLIVTFAVEGSATFSAAGPSGVATSTTSNQDYNLTIDPSALNNGTTNSLPPNGSGQFTVTFAPGQQNIDIFVNAFEDGVKELQEDVRLRLLQNPAYIIGANSVATVVIADNNIVASLNMPDQTLSEFRGDPSPEGNFEILFNDMGKTRFTVFKLEGTATRGTDYTPQAMYMHLPTGGELSSVKFTGATVDATFTPAGGSSQTVSLQGSGWYVNTPPTVTFDPLDSNELVGSIDALQITASDTVFTPGATVVFNNIGISSLTNGRSARGYGTVDSQGRLTLVRLIDSGFFRNADLIAHPVLDFFPNGTVSNGTGVSAGRANASIVKLVPSGSRATGVAVLNGCVTEVSIASGGTGYTSATVSFVNKSGDTTGTGAAGTVVRTAGVITGVIITNPGKLYQQAPDVVITGDGTGATATSTIEGPVIRVNVTNAGLGYASVPGLTFGASVTASSVGLPIVTANALTDFTRSFNPLVGNPDFFTSRSSGQDDRTRRDWTVKLNAADTNAASINKKGFNTLEVIAGGGPLTIGDVITIAGDSQLYTVTGKTLPADVTGDIFFKLTVSPSLAVDATDDAVVTNAITSGVGDISNFKIPARTSFDQVGYYAMDVGVTPVDDGEVEGAESVTLRMLANNDYLIQNPSVQTMVIADDDVVADISLVNNGSEPNLSGKARVTLTKALTKDVTIPFMISGTATPGAGLDTDLSDLGSTAQAHANNRDYVMTGLTDILPPAVDASGNVFTPASARGSITIPAGQTAAELIVGVQDDSFTEGVEIVVITLQRTNDVVLAGTTGSNANPSVTVNISDNLGSVSVSNPVDGIEDPTSPKAGKIRFIVDGNPQVATTNIGVGFTLGGSATFNADYILGGGGFTVNPQTGSGSAVLKAQTPIWVTAVNGTTITLDADQDPLGAANLSSATLQNGATVIIAGGAYVINTGSATPILVRSDGSTTVTLDRVLDDAVVGTSMVLNTNTNKNSTSVKLLPAVASNLPPKTGLLIHGRIYLTGNTEVLPLSTGGTTVPIVPALRDDVSAGDAVFVACRPATDLLVQVKDDLIAEGTESVQVNLTTGSGYSISPIASSATSAIIDDEPQVSVSAIQDAFEPRVNGRFRISYDRFDHTALNREVQVNFAVTDPSATIDAFGFTIQTDLATGARFSVDASGKKHFFASSGKDYQPFSGFTVTIPAGSTFIERSVDVMPDSASEQSEEVQIAVSSSASSAYSIVAGIASVIINDAPTVSVKTIRDATESGIPGIIRFSRTATGSTSGFFGSINVVAHIDPTLSTAVPDVVGTNASANDFPVNSNSFLSQPGGDDTQVNISVNIPSGQEFVDVSIPVTDDNVADKGEFLVVVVDASTDYNLGNSTGTTCSLNIIDNEPSVTITAGRDANEGGQSGQFVISLAAPVPATHTSFKVPLKLTGDAVFGTDYTVTGQTVNPQGQILIVDFPANQSSVTLSIVPRSANGITDPVRTVTLTQVFGSSNLVTGRIATTGDASLTASIKILDDLPIISLVRKTPPVTANDTDLAEPGIDGGFRIVASVVPTADLTVKFSFPGSGSAGFATLGQDYDVKGPATQATAVIQSGQSFVDVGLRVIDDQLIEGIEGIDIALQSNGPLYAIDPSRGTLSLLLGDDEFTEGRPSISVVADVVTAYEEKAIPGSFTLTRSLGVGPMIVEFAMSGTATAADYALSADPDPANQATVSYDSVANKGTVIFPSGQTVTRVILTPVDDVLPEGVETAVLTISPKKVYDITERSSASIDIADNDIVTSLTVITPNAAEAGFKAGQFRITSVPSTVAREFTFRAEGTATPTDQIADSTADYVLIARFAGQTDFSAAINLKQLKADHRLTATIPANVDFMDFQLVLTVDSTTLDTDLIPEGRETAIFTLEENNAYILGSPRSGLITVADNDVQVRLTAKDGGEPSTSGAFTVTLSKPLPVDVDIPFTVGGTATPGADYTALQPLRIKAGQTSGNIIVDVKRDNLEEPTETVIASLAQSPDYVISGSPTATVNIVDLYATVSVSAAPAFADERFIRPASSGVPSADQDISRFRISAQRVTRIDGKSPGFTVFYTLTGTATAGLDYAVPLSVGQIAIPDNVSEVFLNIDPISDDLLEGDETVQLTLLAGPGYDVDGTKATATLSILDSAPILGLVNKSDGAESGKHPVVFTVSYSGSALSRPVKAFYQIVTASVNAATPGSDFNPGDGFVIIPSGSNSIDLSLAVIDDAIVEPTENVVVRLLADPSVTPSYGVNPALVQATAVITDNEPTISIQVTSGASIVEGTDGKFTLSYPGPALDRAIDVSFQLSGTAQVVADYTVLNASNGVATIPANQTSVDVIIRTIDDTVRELDETVVMTLPVNEAGGYRIFTGQVPASASLTIRDNDNATPITISVAKVTDAEEVGVLGKFTISLSEAAPVDTSVSYSLSGTATLGDDYSIPPSPIVISAGNLSVDITVDAKHDGIPESDETVVLTLGTPPTSSVVTYANSLSSSTATMLIKSDPRDAFPEGLPQVSVDADRVTAYETNEVSGSMLFTRSLGVGSMDLKFTLTGTATTADYQVLLTDDRVLPAQKVDFSPSTGLYTLHFTAGVSTIPVFIKPVDDRLAEGIENVIAAIQSGSAYEITARSSASIDIADNDIVTTLTVTDPLAIESTLKSGQFRIASLPSTVDRHFTFRVDGTAVLGNLSETAKDYAIKFKFQGDSQFQDFKPTGSTDKGFRIFGTLPTGVDFIDFQVAITRDSNGVDDNLPEGRETAIFTLEESNEFALGSPHAGLITIADNDIQVSITGQDGGEPGTSGLFTVKLSNPLPVDVAIPYTVGGTATSGLDYSPLQPLTIKAGDTTGTILVNVLPDNLVESTETVKVTLSNSLDYVISGNATATVNIVDLYATVSVTASTTFATELFTRPALTGTASDDVSRFTISLQRVPHGTPAPGFKVYYSLTGTATMGTDYVTPPQVGSISIPDGVDTVFLNIDPLSDNVFEGDETVTLTLNSGPGYDIDGAKNTATLKILDSAPVVGVAKKSDGAETGSQPMIFTFSYTGPALPRSVKVFYQNLDPGADAATPGLDFDLGAGFVTIPSGQTSIDLALPVIDDLSVEPTENVKIGILIDPTVPPVYGINPAHQTDSATIIDNEPTVSLALGFTGTVSEGGSNGSFRVSYSGTALTRPVAVSFILSGDATQGLDYTLINAAAGVAIIPANQTFIDVGITVIDDALKERDESVIMTLPVNNDGGYRLATGNIPATAQFVIKDNDNIAPIKISVTAVADAAETGAVGQFTIALDDTAPVATVIPFTITGTATFGVDYTTVPLSVTIPSRSLTATVSIRAIPDGVIEADETVVLTLGTPPTSDYINDTARSTASIIIKSDPKDGPPAGSLVSADSAGKGGCSSGSGIALMVGLAGFLFLRRRRAA